MSSESDDEFRFEAEICDPKKLIAMLRSIHIMKTTVMAITSRGLKLTCQDTGLCLQANSFIDRSLFTRYHMSSEETPVSVCFRLADLIHVLSLLGSTARTARSGQLSDNILKIQYTTSSDKIRLQFREETTETKAYVKTYAVEELMIFNMNSSVNKVILSVEPIVDFWKHADLSSEYIELSINETEPHVQWSTESERARVNHRIHRNSTFVEQFLHSKNVCHRYRMSLMKFTLKALIHSSKLSVRTDDEGVLSLQFMVKLVDHLDVEHCFVEYFIVPEADHQFLQL